MNFSKADFIEKLRKNREKIINQWFQAAINTYPPETARILDKSKNKFDNPVGCVTKQSLEDVWDKLFHTLGHENRKNENIEQKEINQEKIEEALDPVIRIRAVQSFSASKAVEFVFELKGIVKKIIGTSLNSSFEKKVDEISLAAFNRFMKCRENIFLLKATEAKRRVHKAFERAGLVKELTEEQLLSSNNKT
ncbi:MAG: hypothetical protein B6I26_05025 [Desulfobacteraceae bacterium 4572_130]|nr:MAG: hypothetical protein B6I26_05025 [Desulfobacteraceae bacterium 4572_130]